MESATLSQNAAGGVQSAIYGALIGSTPHKLMHISKRPVLVVPAPGR